MKVKRVSGTYIINKSGHSFLLTEEEARKFARRVGDDEYGFTYLSHDILEWIRDNVDKYCMFYELAEDVTSQVDPEKISTRDNYLDMMIEVETFLDTEFGGLT